MSDYDTDIVTWSATQAALLRRVAEGARINDRVDWDNIIEEIETVGRSETDGVISLLTNAMTHKLMQIGWPNHEAARHWQHEVRVFLADAADKHRASMRVNMDKAFRLAVLKAEAHMVDAGPPAPPLPEACPWTLAELLSEGEAALHPRMPE